MRSRYSAYCVGDADYLIATHLGEPATAENRAAIQRSAAATEWLNLTIVRVQGGGSEDGAGTVEFAAAFRPKSLAVIGTSTPGKVAQMHERSNFVREEGRWLYVDGEQLPPFAPSRGASCWCGSGKKFKRCHG